MERWGQSGGIKMKMLVTYDYQENELILSPPKGKGYDIYLSKKPK